jgi:uncharacterized protein with gpF-like domain
MAGAGPIPREAVRWLRALDVAVPPDPEVLWRELYAGGLQIAGQAREDVIAWVRDGLAKALERGESYAQWRDGLREALVTSGWRARGTDTPSRLHLIHTMAARTARAVGQWRRIEETVDTMPYLVYELGPVRTRHRDEHLEYAGLVLRADDPWWRVHLPPRGFRCKCRVRQVSAYEAQRLGVSVAPKDRLVTWRTPDGREVRLPFGVEPGFETHPAFSS